MVRVGSLLSPHTNIWASVRCQAASPAVLTGTDTDCSGDVCPGDVGWHKFKGLKGKFTFFFFSGRPNNFRTLNF